MKSFILVLLSVSPAFAISTVRELEPATVGSMEVRRSGERRQSLELRRLDVAVEAHGDVTQTSVEHDFYNDSDERLEGTFRFPLPTGGEITGLAMEIDGRMVEGELLERQRAERIFDKTVDEMRDPALLTWEAGNVFKLRVFPIEPNAHKRVVVRYMTPAKDAKYTFSAPQVGQFHFTLDGKTLYDENQFQPKTITVDIPSVRERALREVVAGATYQRVELPVAAAHRQRARGPYRWVVVVDVSRSALEARPLTLDSVRAALSALPPGDQFVLLACDIQCRQSAPTFSTATDEALRFLESIEFDGATDLGLALKWAAARARIEGGQILYIGDGNPTWGITDPAELAQSLEPALAGTPVHALILGKYAQPALLTRLANRGGGLLMAPTRKDEVVGFARALAGFGRAPRLSDLSLTVADGSTVTPSRPASIDAGEALTAFVRTDKDHTPPASVHLRALLDGQPFEKEISLGHAINSPLVARRFAGSRIRELEAEGGHDDEVLALSLEHKVLSSKTAWLVLENEEAYRRNEIARNERTKSADPTVSGKNLGGGDDSAGSVGGEGPEPELWLLLGLALVAFQFRRRLGAVR
jgi:hypothetical protein